MFEVRAVDGDPGRIVQVVGELDIATVPLLSAVLDSELLATPEGLTLDLTDLTFVDSSGARELASAAKRGDASGVEVLLACPKTNRAVRRVLDLLQIGALVPIVEAVGDDPQAQPGAAEGE